MATTRINTSPVQDEAEIRVLIAAWSKALEAKDIDGLVANYAADPLLFDAVPPHRTRGVDAIRAVWANCLPYFPDRFKSEHRDLRITVDGDLAFVHGYHHFVPDPENHPCGSTWMRVTVCFRRLEGNWRVVHEHVSIPFDPETNRAVYIADPDREC